MSGLVCSGTMDCEFLDDWICQQFGGEFSNANGLGFADSRCSRIAGVFLLRARWTRLGRPLCPAGNGRPFGVGDLNLESFALANGNDLGEAEPMAGAGNCLALRVVDLGLEHDVHNYLGHAAQRMRSRHLTWQEERRVLSQRSTKSDDRPLTCRRAALSR